MNYAIVLFNANGLGMTIKEFTNSQQALDYAQTLKKYMITKETGLYLVLRSYFTNSDYMSSVYDSIVADIAYLESEIKLQTDTQLLQS